MSYISSMISRLKAEKANFENCVVDTVLPRLSRYRDTIPAEDLPDSYCLAAGACEEPAYTIVENGALISLLDGETPWQDEIESCYRNIAKNPWLEELSGLVDDVMRENHLVYHMDDGEIYGIDYDCIGEALNERYADFCEQEGYPCLLSNSCSLNELWTMKLSAKVIDDWEALSNLDNWISSVQCVMQRNDGNDNGEVPVDKYRSDVNEWYKEVVGYYNDAIRFFQTLQMGVEGLDAFSERIGQLVPKIVSEMCEEE